MSPVSFRRRLRHARHRVAVVLVLLGLAGAVVVHHGMPMGMSAMADQGICLAILGGTAVLAAGVAVVVAGRKPPPREEETAEPENATVRPLGLAVPARAGPLYLRLEVLRL